MAQNANWVRRKFLEEYEKLGHSIIMVSKDQIYK